MNAAFMLARRARTTLVRLAWVLAVGGTCCGCSSLTSDVCDARCRCEACSDRDREACEIEVDAEFDVYDVYECSDEATAMYDCAVARGECRDGHWSYADGCPLEHDALEWCVSRASSAHGAPDPGRD